MRQIVTDFLADKAYRTWVKENPLWWCLFRTEIPGSWNDSDVAEFNKCSVKYLIYLDHTMDSKARELAIYLLDRYEFFKAAKVSKYARDGEKVLVLLGRDASYRDSLAEFVKSWNMLLFKVKPIDTLTEHDKAANSKWGTYLMRLARAFRPPA